MVRALASHQCCLGSIPCPGVMWVEFVVGSCPYLGGFLRILQFSSLHKNQCFQIPSGISGQRATVWRSHCKFQFIVIYIFIYFIVFSVCFIKKKLYVIYFSLHSRPVPTSCRLCPGYITPTVPSGACAASTSEGKFRIYCKQPF